MPIVMTGRTIMISSILVATVLSAMPLDIKGFSVSEPPKNLGAPVNSSANDFAPTLSPDGTIMIFNSNRGGGYQDLYITRLAEGKWSVPEPLAEVNSPFNDETPFLSPDGNTLVFSSDRDGSMEMPRNERGQIRVSFDLYVSRKVNGAWSRPVPLPGDINSEHHEKSPSLSNDGKTLYYNMWPFGDINRSVLVQAEFRGGVFTNRKLMPAPFNQGHREFSLIPAEDLGGFFFSASRPENIGALNLYFVSYSGGKFGTPENLGPKINSDKADLYLARADQRYYIASSREGGNFDIYSSVVFTPGKSFQTRAIHFDFDKAVIRPESSTYLKALSGYLKENPKIKLEIIGHTDLHGTADYNRQLSLRRAQAVKEYLVREKLEPGRFSVSGAGASRPVKEGTGSGIDELNRRTEFKIVE